MKSIRILKTIKWGVAVFIASLGIACSPQPKQHVVKIGVIAPLDAGLTHFGTSMRNAVQIAVDQANATQAIPGWKIELQALDDSSNPETGARAAQQLAKDPLMIGVIGTYNSGVAMMVAPILAQAGIAMISPANTDPVLTLGTNPAQPTRPFSTYFRMVATDKDQGPFLATYAYRTLGLKKAAIVTEEKEVSQGLAHDFSTHFTALGGTVVMQKVAAPGTTDYRPLLTAIAATQPDFLFYGGEYKSGAAVRSQAHEVGITVPMMGGDGLKDDGYTTTLKQTSTGDYASTVGAPADALPSVAPFLQEYAARKFSDAPTDYSPYAYDAANLLIAATAQALKTSDTVNAAARHAVIQAVQNTQTSGITGTIAFDAFGDTTHPVLTMYQVQAGMWKPILTQTLPRNKP